MFPLKFPVLAAEHIYLVTFDAKAGKETAIASSKYTVSGCNTAFVAVTNAPNGKPLASGVKLTIYRLVPHIQQTDLENGGVFDAEVIEDEFDNLVM